MGGERNADRLIAELGALQHGIVARSQLIERGISGRRIERRLQSGRLHALHRGVYAVGHAAVTRHGRWMAAVLAGGPGAALSHHAAAALWQLRDPRGGPVDVTVARQQRAVKGIRFRRARLPPDEVGELHDIPVTSMPRTLLDLAAVVDARALERALNEADYLRLADPLSLHVLLKRYPRRIGSPKLRDALRRRAAGATRTRSEMEELFLHLLDTHGLPRPRINALIPGVGEVDCSWPGPRLAVELDGRRAHATLAAFEQDRARDRLLQTAGWRVIRLTWRQLIEDERRLAEDLTRLLGATVST